MLKFLIIWILSMAATAESANSNSSTAQATTTSGATVVDWLKVTAVPLGVFLIGACIWGIIADTTARWRNSFNGRGGGPPEAEEVPAHRHSDNNAPNARDLEEGLELSHGGMDDDLAMAPNPPVGRDVMMQPELESPNNRET